MNILDENIIESQRQLLLDWRGRFSQIGYEVGRRGMDDEEIIPFLLSLLRPTFFTLDLDFYERNLCHRKYCLVFLNVKQGEAATYVRRLLRHREFNTHAKRMGILIRVSSTGLLVWRLHLERETRYDWPDDRRKGSRKR